MKNERKYDKIDLYHPFIILYRIQRIWCTFPLA